MLQCLPLTPLKPIKPAIAIAKPGVRITTAMLGHESRQKILPAECEVTIEDSINTS